MILGRKNQYCENDYTTKCNLQIQCNPYQITNDIFHRTRTKKFTIHMETHKIPNSQSSLEEEEWTLEESTFLTSDYTTKLQSSRQYGTDTKKRNIDGTRQKAWRSMHLWKTYLWQRRQKYTMEKKQSLQITGAGKQNIS